MSLSDDEVKKGNVLKGIQNWVAILNLRETLLLKNTNVCVSEVSIGVVFLCVLGFVVPSCVTS